VAEWPSSRCSTQRATHSAAPSAPRSSVRCCIAARCCLALLLRAPLPLSLAMSSPSSSPSSAAVTATGEKYLSPGVEFGSKLAAGAVAGIIGVTCTFPLDFAKTRLQKQKTLEYKGMGDCLRQVYRQQGARGWYSGLRPNLTGIIPEKAIKLACADQFRDWLRDPHTGRVSLAAELVAGAGAGFCQVVVTTPMEIVKIRCQLTGASMVSVVRELGLRGLYKGYVPTLTRDVWFSAIFFPLQAKMKESIIHRDDSSTQKTLKSFLAGITAGAVASGLSTPVDVIKTRLQGGDPGGVLTILSNTIKTEGYGALWKGLQPRMIAIGPLFGIAIMVYDVQKRLLRSMGYHVPE